MMLFTGCTIFPHSKEHYLETAANAFYDSSTMIPLMGAVIFSVNDFDQKASNWAQKETPLFSSRQDALKASDTLRYGVDNASALLILTSPVKDDELWLNNKGKVFLNAAVSHSLTLNTTGKLKRETDRQRPHGGSVYDSFPSAHSSTAWNYAAVARRFNHQHQYSEATKTMIDYSVNLTAAGVAWARVEGGVHYPSDVLFGAALGNFIGLLIYDAFIGSNDKNIIIRI